MAQPQYILVAEDNHAYGSVYKRKLEREGFEVAVAEDGEAAMAMIKQRHPDLLILDMLMPKKDGMAVLTELKADPATQPIPILIATNLSQEDDMEKALVAGAVGYFVKSNITVAEMVAKVKQHLGPAPSTAAS